MVVKSRTIAYLTILIERWKMWGKISRLHAGHLYAVGRGQRALQSPVKALRVGVGVKNNFDRDAQNLVVPIGFYLIKRCEQKNVILYLGYNHPSMLKIWENDSNIRTLVNRPALGYYPNVEWPDMLKRVLLSVAPPGLNQVHNQCNQIGRFIGLWSTFQSLWQQLFAQICHILRQFL